MVWSEALARLRLCHVVAVVAGWVGQHSAGAGQGWHTAGYTAIQGDSGICWICWAQPCTWLGTASHRQGVEDSVNIFLFCVWFWW